MRNRLTYLYVPIFSLARGRSVLGDAGNLILNATAFRAIGYGAPAIYSWFWSVKLAIPKKSAAAAWLT